MADFCRACYSELFGDGSDFTGLVTETQWAEGYAAAVLCEGCGFTLVDPRGNCVGDCFRAGEPGHEGEPAPPVLPPELLVPPDSVAVGQRVRTVGGEWPPDGIGVIDEQDGRSYTVDIRRTPNGPVVRFLYRVTLDWANPEQSGLVRMEGWVDPGELELL